MSFRFKPLSLLVAASIASGLASLSACGRRGPLELPPDVQAQGRLLKAEEEAKAKSSAKSQKQPEAIPGTIGHRPPDQYPFVLDPLL